jgi:hypothetical protein
MLQLVPTVTIRHIHGTGHALPLRVRVSTLILTRRFSLTFRPKLWDGEL